MIDEKKKMTTHASSVGADDGQSISKNSDISITTSKEEINDEVVKPQESLEKMYRKIQRMSDPAYLHTVTLDELMDNVFEVKSAVIENLLYTGAYILAGAPKIGKSFGGADRPPCQHRAGFVGLQGSSRNSPLSCSGR